MLNFVNMLNNNWRSFVNKLQQKKCISIEILCLLIFDFSWAILMATLFLVINITILFAPFLFAD